MFSQQVYHSTDPPGKRRLQFQRSLFDWMDEFDAPGVQRLMIDQRLGAALAGEVVFAEEMPAVRQVT